MEDEITRCGSLPHVAGVTTNPAIMARSQATGVEEVLKAAVATGRKDWKIWVQLEESPYPELLERAQKLNETIGGLTGGVLAGPTLVFKIMPSLDGLWAASALYQKGMEICVTGIANQLQAMAVATLPSAVELTGSRFETEGPPGCRMPCVPHHIAYYLGRVADTGRDAIGELLAMARQYSASAIRTRILAGSIRSMEVLRELAMKAAAAGAQAIDVTLPGAIIDGLLHDPVTSAAAREFEKQPDLGPTAK